MRFKPRFSAVVAREFKSGCSAGNWPQRYACLALNVLYWLISWLRFDVQGTLCAVPMFWRSKEIKQYNIVSWMLHAKSVFGERKREDTLYGNKVHIFRLRNDLYCVGSGVKLYSLTQVHIFHRLRNTSVWVWFGSFRCCVEAVRNTMAVTRNLWNIDWLHDAKMCQSQLMLSWCVTTWN